MSISSSMRVYSRNYFRNLFLLTLCCVIAFAGLASVDSFFAVSAAGKVSVEVPAAKRSTAAMGTASTGPANGQVKALSSIATRPSLSPDTAGSVTVSLLPHVTGVVGSVAYLPITVSDLTGLGVIAYDLQVTYDPTILRPATTPCSTVSTLSSGMVITPNPNHSGHIIISGFQATELSGSGTLLNLVFVVIGHPGQTTQLNFEDYTDPIPRFHAGLRFNAGSPQANTFNNTLTVQGPTAAAATVSGQVRGKDGQGISGATVLLIGGEADVKTVTDDNGLYSFEDLTVGEFYTVTATLTNYTFTPNQRAFSLNADRLDEVFMGIPDAVQYANPIDTSDYFVRQQYRDFLVREPDQPGFEYWTEQLNSCNGDAECLRQRRIGVSAAFVIEQEFQRTGLFLYGLYKGALGRNPLHEEYATDRGTLVGGADLDAKKQAFIEGFVDRFEFTGKYQAEISAESFVDALLANVEQTSEAAGADLRSRRAALVSLYRTGTSQTNSRGLVLREVTESAAVKSANYNAGFVLAEYFGYLQRDPDQSGYDFWLNVLNNTEPLNYRGMVCAFITSTEYQLRFATVVKHSNADCGQ